MKYTVIVMRPDSFLYEVEGFDSTQEMQYVATNVEAADPTKAGRKARLEAFKADVPTLNHHMKHNGAITACDTNLNEIGKSDYIVLGTIDESGSYTPWLNGGKP